MSHLVNPIKFLIFYAVLALMPCRNATAAEKATAAEAEAMVIKTVAHIKKFGAEATYAEITHGKMFKDRELYAFVYDIRGKNLAHGANPKLVGKELIGMRDPDGKLLNKELIEVAVKQGKGWSPEFKFMNPVSQKIERRKVYVELLNDTVVGCGIFLE